MNIDNITSSSMTLDYYGKMAQIKLYENLIQEKDKKIKHLQNLINKTTNYYLKTLSKNGSMPKEAVEMFNLLEGNKQ